MNDESEIITRRISDRVMTLIKHKNLIEKESEAYESEVYSSSKFNI